MSTFNVPTELRMGDSWSWDSELPLHPDPTWQLSYFFVNASQAFSIAATGNGTTFTTTQTAVESAALTPGNYEWAARVVNGADIQTLGTGRVEIIPDLTAVRDTRSHARRLLDAVNATLEGRATSDEQAVMINNRSITRLTLSELREWKISLEDTVRAEEAGEDAGLGRNIAVRFNRI